GAAGAPRPGSARVRLAVRPHPRAHRAPLPAPPRPQRHRVSPDGPGGSRAVRSARSPVPGSRVSGERCGTTARARPRLCRDGAARGLGVAYRVSTARHRVPPRADRLAVRHGAASPRVTFLHPLALIGLAAAAIARAGSGDRLWLILADGVARAGSREALLATVDSVQPDWRRLDLTAAVARATRLVDAEPLPGREVEVVSDLQRTAFGVGRAE